MLEIKLQIIKTAKELLDLGLVARTWGNVSARIDDAKFYITPSGRAYETMTEDEIPEVEIKTAKWQGKYKPSGEMGIHIAAYKHFDDVNFIIHTHQTAASAIALTGPGSLKISPKEKQKLGKLAFARYGRTGSKKLNRNISNILLTGAHTILLPHHGTLILAKDAKEAIDRALLLEEICQNSLSGQANTANPKPSEEAKLLKSLKNMGVKIPVNFQLICSDAAISLANRLRVFKPELEDMAQIVGTKIIRASNPAEINKLLDKRGVCMVRGLGILLSAKQADDLSALNLIVQKSIIVKLHTLTSHQNHNLGDLDALLEHLVYTQKYSKQKEN